MRVGPPSPANVATRYLQAGVLQAPPAMHAAILEWVYAVVAARAIHGYEEALTIKDPNPARTEAIQALRDAMEVLRAAPTKWNAYKAVYDASWIFGHPGTRWDVKLFQKPTPESKALLEQRVQRLLQGLEDRLESEAEGDKAQQRRIEGEIARLLPYTRPDVPYTGEGDASKKFPVDLTGWRYGDEEIKRRVQEVGSAQAREMVKLYEQMDGDAKQGTQDIYDRLLNLTQTNVKHFDHIWAVLKSEPIRGAKAYWQAVGQQVVIAIPQGATPYDLGDLSETLRHELQHFAQSYLSVAMGGDSYNPKSGMPSQRVRTPEFKQHMSPTHPGHRKDDPATQEVMRKWKEQGLDPSQIDFHSLDDIEFHTEIADTISEFEKQWGYARSAKGHPDKGVAVKLFSGVLRQPQTHDYRDTGKWYEAMEALGGYDFVKWFDPSHFLLALKKHAPGKWRRAVSELVAAVL